jgi:hypothetical protein
MNNDFLLGAAITNIVWLAALGLTIGIRSRRQHE